MYLYTVRYPGRLTTCHVHHPYLGLNRMINIDNSKFKTCTFVHLIMVWLEVWKGFEMLNLGNIWERETLVMRHTSSITKD